MALHPEYERRLRAWLDKKKPGLTPCAFCGKNAWAIGQPLLIEAAAFPISQTDLKTADHVGLCPLVCANCGLLMFFSAVTIGLATEQLDFDQS